MALKYKEFAQLHLPSIEQEIFNKWEATSAFEKSLSLRSGKEPFVFYEGPPSANGLPGIHHVISRTLKDLVCRFKTMQGYQVKRKGGWDTHGLPVELGVEKTLGITKEDIGVKISVEEYNRKCREEVMKFKHKWDELTQRIGYWVDLEHPYITFENEYIETLWWALKTLHQKQLLYKSVSIQPYSPAAGTGLSSHELNQPGTYKDVKDTSVVAMFKAVHNKHAEFLFQYTQSGENAGKERMPQNEEIFLLAWTTTPWTLPSNLGLTVGPAIDYVLIKTFNPYTHLPINVILARALVNRFFKVEGENASFNDYHPGEKMVPWKILAEFKGVDLKELQYEQLLPYEANSPEKSGGNPFRVVCGDFVTTEDGTGIVHTAPAFGADDYKVGKKYDLGILVMVDREGKFVDGLGEFSHRFVKNYRDDPAYEDVNVDISVKLKKENRAFRVEKYEHSYPHCWRTDKPVIYYPLDAWFIRTTAVKDRMVELNKSITWKPAATGTGRFGNWLENMVDWNLSRSRYWGTPLPVWRTEDGTEEICIGSIRELNEEMKKANAILGGEINKHYLHEGILDLHKPYVDEIVLVSPSGKPMHREPDLVDVWFDSGAMPFAQWGLPPVGEANENIISPSDLLAYWSNNAASGNGNGSIFPADFIAEGVDQTRGWFYTLHALGVMLFDSVAYRTVVSNGFVLDKNGNKMSKRLGNVVDPFEIISKYGADATRWYLITNASPWDNLKFDEEGIKEIQRKFFGTLYNTYQFFALYANVDGFNYSQAEVNPEQKPEIDRWILSSLNSLIVKVTAAFEEYEPTLAGRLVEDFLDKHLSNWYVRLSRRRFWKGEYEENKISAYQTLYTCLDTIAGLMAPIAPFFADWLFDNLNEVTGRQAVGSVHHMLFPVADYSLIDKSLEERMQMAQDASSLVLSLRKKVNIKVRQPLQKVLIPVLDPGMKDQLEKIEELLKSEVNIKGIQYIIETEGLISKKIRPNFQALGKKLGSKMKAVSAAIGAFTQQDITSLERSGSYTLQIDGEPVVIQANEVDITSEDIPGWIVASKDNITVALDITITPDLENEGNARELVNRIQKLRKDNGYELTDRILVKVEQRDTLNTSITQFNDYICAEILADKLELVPELVDGTQIEINDIPLRIFITKKGN